MEEGQGYLMNLKYLKLFDKTDEYIAPVRKEKGASWRYFSARVGYVEISRNGCLEVLPPSFPPALLHPESLVALTQ